MDINISSPIVVQTAAQWAADATVYSAKRILVTSDEYYGSTDQRKFKIADGTQTWSQLDYVPISQSLSEVLGIGNKTNEIPITSNNGESELHIHDSEFYLSRTWATGFNSITGTDLDLTINRSSGDSFNSLQFTDVHSILSYSSGLKVGYVEIDETDTEIYHDDLISLNAPSVQKNGYEIATQSFVDNRVQSNIKIVGDWDATSGSYPLADESNVTPFIAQWGATIKQGWAWRVGYGQAGTVGGYDYEEGDVIYALVDSPTNTTADWGDLDHNLQQATESLRGTAKITTNAIIDDETTTDDERVVSSKKFWRGISRLLAIANTWALKQTFTTAPRLSSTTANQRLEVDSNKDIISVAKGTADNKNFGTTAGTVLEGDRITQTITNGVTDKAPSEDAVYNALALKSSFLSLKGLNFSPSDALSYYFVDSEAPNTNAQLYRFYCPSNIVIKKVYIYFAVTTTLGSTETSSIYIRVNNTTDSLISNAVNLSTAASTVSNTSFNLSISAGSYFNIKWTTPTWVTNPTNIQINAVLEIANG